MTMGKMPPPRRFLHRIRPQINAEVMPDRGRRERSRKRSGLVRTPARKIQNADAALAHIAHPAESLLESHFQPPDILPGPRVSKGQLLLHPARLSLPHRGFKFAVAARTRHFSPQPMNRDAATPATTRPSTAPEIAARFLTHGQFLSAAEIPTGLINSTHCASFTLPDGSIKRYILQAINPAVFEDPLAVMRNVETVIRHQQSLSSPSAPTRSLTLVPTREGHSWTQDHHGRVWRCYDFIEGCGTHDVVENPQLAREAGRAFGNFQRQVRDLDPALLTETIPEFHDTPLRLQRLLAAAEQDSSRRLASVAAEMNFIRERHPLIPTLHHLTSSGEIPLRVVHNDTKINNVMMDIQSGEAVCVIDLDTVMPGLALHDFGDLVRSAANPSREDETDLSKVKLQLPLFEALAEGYLSATLDFLTPAELTHLVLSVKLITLELAIRFLTDHLEGDRYFKIERGNHNLDRCRNQLRLVASIEEQEPHMHEALHRVIQRLQTLNA